VGGTVTGTVDVVMTTRWATSCAGTEVRAGVGTVVAGAVDAGAAVWLVAPEAAPEAGRADVFDASFHGGVPLWPGDEPWWGPGPAPPFDAEAVESFWINRSGTISSAPHKRSAAPGRLPPWILVLRTPLSLRDVYGCALWDGVPQGAHPPPRGRAGRLLQVDPRDASDDRTPITRVHYERSHCLSIQNDRCNSGRQREARRGASQQSNPDPSQRRPWEPTVPDRTRWRARLRERTGPGRCGSRPQPPAKSQPF
jgi:hypothetical protein